MTSSAAHPIFGGHEKFTFRNGWLEKGVLGITEDSTLFQQEDALVKLGVGKNMVRSIRHWCLAAGLLEVNEDLPASLQLTNLAKCLFIEKWDPFFEDVTTLWLIHANLATNIVRCKAWQWVFSFASSEFSKIDMFQHFVNQASLENLKVTTKVLESELDCILRTYISIRPKSGRHYEESYDSPLIDLDLVRAAGDDSRIYHFNIGPKPTLPIEVVCYALIRYISTHGQNRQTFSVEECRLGVDSPGQIFKIDENSMIDYMEQLPDITDGRIGLQEAGGVNQLTWDLSKVEAESLSLKVMASYYGR